MQQRNSGQAIEGKLDSEIVGHLETDTERLAAPGRGAHGVALKRADRSEHELNARQAQPIVERFCQLQTFLDARLRFGESALVDQQDAKCS